MLQMLKRKDSKRVEYMPSIGEYSTGEPLTFDPSNFGNWLIAGMQGSGKSSYVNALLSQLQYFDFQLYGIDCKNGLELLPWRNVLEDVATNRDEAMDTIGHVQTIMQQRLDYLRDNRLRKWPNKDRAVLIVDELAEVLSIDHSLPDKQAKHEAKQRLDGLTNLARLGRASGVHVVSATQHPLANIVGSELKANLNIRVCCRVGSQETFKMVMGDSYNLDYETIHYPGSGYVLGLPDCLFQPRLAKAYWTET